MKFTSILFNVNSAKAWINSLNSSKLPKQHFNIIYSRSSGPGGQKVNKTSSKSTITLSYLDWIPIEIRQQLIDRKFRYLNKSGSIVISSDETRNQQDNLELCFNKFCNELKKTVFFPNDISKEDLAKWEKVYVLCNLS